uniref:Uncharacterized protein n=1 Tax=Arundo donax TaxID=35708 RepID=A0A0A9FP58_ARUDO
MPVVSALAR